MVKLSRRLTIEARRNLLVLDSCYKTTWVREEMAACRHERTVPPQ